MAAESIFSKLSQPPKLDLVSCAEENSIAQICFAIFEKFLTTKTNFGDSVDMMIFVPLLDADVLSNVVRTQVVLLVPNHRSHSDGFFDFLHMYKIYLYGVKV